MTARRPLAVINGTPTEIPVGDSIASDLVAAGSGAIFDGGNASSTYSGGPVIDCGHAV